jgi:hypothetical protein
MVAVAVVSQLAESVGAAALGAVTPLGGRVAVQVSAAVAVAVCRLAEPVGAAARPVWRVPEAGPTALALPLAVLPP